jgi:hypothetical protein
MSLDFIDEEDYRSFKYFEGVNDEVTCGFYPGVTAILGWSLAVKCPAIKVVIGQVNP